MVPTSAIVGMVIESLIAFILPIAGVIYLRIKCRIAMKPVLVGLIIFIVFSQVLEKLVHTYVLVLNPTTKAWLENPWLYATYGGLMAGIFEEVGRYTGFKLFLKKNRTYQDGLAYGMGHGGIESILIVAVSAIEYLVFSMMINAGTFSAQVAAKLPTNISQQLIKQLTSTGWWSYLEAGLERFPAMAIHVALSLIVLYGIRVGKTRFLALAIFLHAAIDFYTALIQKGVFPMWTLEVFLWGVFIVATVFIIKVKDAFLKLEFS